MRSRRRSSWARCGAVTALVLAACGGGNVASSGGSSSGSGGGTFNAGRERRPQPVRRKTGGTLRIGNTGDWDSLDPADTYYGYSWNFVRLYGRSLMMFKSAPGQGRRHSSCPTSPSARQAQRRRQDLDLQAAHGRQVRGRHADHVKDVKYAVERSLDKNDVPERADVLQRLPRPAGLHLALQGHRPEQAGPEGDRDAGRQDDHLPPDKPFAGFDYFASCRPPSRCRGQGHRHEVQGARGLHRPVHVRDATTWARASRWCATPTGTRRPTRTARRCRTGSRCSSTSTPTTSTTGCSPATSTSTWRARACRPRRAGQDPGRPEAEEERRLRADRPALVHRRSAPTSPPLDNIHCRKAVEYAADKTGYQTRLRRRRPAATSRPTCCRR